MEEEILEIEEAISGRVERAYDIFYKRLEEAVSEHLETGDSSRYTSALRALRVLSGRCPVAYKRVLSDTEAMIDLFDGLNKREAGLFLERYKADTGKSLDLAA